MRELDRCVVELHPDAPPAIHGPAETAEGWQLRTWQPTPDTLAALAVGTKNALAGDDPEPLAHHVVELPPVRPHVTEYRRHRLTRSRCGRVACVELPPGASSGYGPRVEATAALLSGDLPQGKWTGSLRSSRLCARSYSAGDTYPGVECLRTRL